MATAPVHYHLEVLTDHGFSLSTQHWDTKEDAVRQAEPISRNRVFWVHEHAHPLSLHIPQVWGRA